MNFLFQTSKSLRQLLIENYKAASFYAEDALDHIEDLTFTVSQIDFLCSVNFVLLNGDRVYTAIGETLYEYSFRELTHPIATYPLNDIVWSA